MINALEVTKKLLYSDAHRRSESELIPIEDALFKVFTDFLDELDIFKNPVISRGCGNFKNGTWSILGYSTNAFALDADEDKDNDSTQDDVNSNFVLNMKWEYTVFNGLFTKDNRVMKLTKLEIDNSIKETQRFLDKTFSNNHVNDINEISDLQQHLLDQFRSNNLERLDICIVTDAVIEKDNLIDRFTLTTINLECRIYYWDLRRWDALKRSKSGREPINIDFQSDDYGIYRVPYLHQETSFNLSYYLSIFPGDLIADLYDLHSTRLLENNVRVFLSAKKKENKSIRKTIGENGGSEAHKFFSFNNGISATAEKIEVSNGFISKIYDFQIVNGGQTTSSIHYSKKKDKYNLRDVHVAVKITALKKDDNYSNIVKSISVAANTQSAILPSDFYSNDKQFVQLEQISMKNPAQNEEDRNVYFFFERMKGQYNVSMSSQGTKTQERIWVKSRPQILSFDKIDFAKWSNMMNGLPFLVCEGAQKQFISHMEDTFYERSEIHLGHYKTVIGFGQMFRRIYKLCGTASGKTHLYPSRIIDRNTGLHVPVAASTSIYAASLLHDVTQGRLNYWAIFDFQYGVNNSLLNPKIGTSQNEKRVGSSLDDVFEFFIDITWKAIAEFGGAAAQENSKKKECWEYVKSKLVVPDYINQKLQTFMISEAEMLKRISVESRDETYNYFANLKILLDNDGYVLSSIYGIACTRSEFTAHKHVIYNIMQKLSRKEGVLTFDRISEVLNFYNMLNGQNFDFSLNNHSPIIFNFDLSSIYEVIFKDRADFERLFYEASTRDETRFLEYSAMWDDYVKTMELYDINYGTSILGLEFLQNMVDLVEDSGSGKGS